MAKRWIVLCVICIAAGGLFITAYLHQKAIDECYIELSDNEIKELSARAILRSPRNQSDLNHISINKFIHNAKWVILDRDPVQRDMSVSEYDMALYEVYVDLQKLQFIVFIDKCARIIVQGRRGVRHE